MWPIITSIILDLDTRTLLWGILVSQTRSLRASLLHNFCVMSRSSVVHAKRISQRDVERRHPNYVKGKECGIPRSRGNTQRVETLSHAHPIAKSFAVVSCRSMRRKRYSRAYILRTRRRIRVNELQRRERRDSLPLYLRRILMSTSCLRDVDAPTSKGKVRTRVKRHS